MSGGMGLMLSLMRTHQHLRKHQSKCFFSTTSMVSRSGPAMRVPSAQHIRRMREEQGSVEKRMKNAKRSEISDDYGLMPNTLVLPLSKDMPSLFSLKPADWKFRYNLYKEWAYAKTLEWFQMWRRGDFAPKGSKAWTGFLDMRNRHKLARDLYAELGKAVAANKLEKISEISCTGLKRQSQKRVDQKRADNKLRDMTWSVKFRGFTTDYTGRGAWLLNTLIPPRFKSTQVLLDRCVVLPLGLSTKVRQTILRIKSTQTVDKNDGAGVQTVDKDELIVLQRMEMNGEVDHWRIWGTTKRPNRKQADQILQEFRQQKLMQLDRGQRLQNIAEQSKDKSFGEQAKAFFGG